MDEGDALEEDNLGEKRRSATNPSIRSKGRGID